MGQTNTQGTLQRTYTFDGTTKEFLGFRGRTGIDSSDGGTTIKGLSVT